MDQEALKDLVFKAINMLRDSATDGRAVAVSGHKTSNSDGTYTVAFRHKLGGKTTTFKVGNEAEVKFCFKIMREETRGQ